jgi:hypothetical protein
VEVGGQLHERVPSGDKLNTADALSKITPDELFGDESL